MASRSARPRSSRRVADDFDDAPGGVAGFLMQHRMAVGCVTAFAVAFFYVAANAIWYQPHAHGGAFFATRPLQTSLLTPDEAAQGQPVPETIIRLEREASQTVAQPAVRTPDVGSAGVVPTPSQPPVQNVVARSGDPVVEEVQRILFGLNLYAGDVDGLTGPQTRAAIENYRRIVGLGGGAEIDDQLLAQLGAAPRSASSAPPLPEGSPGTDLIETSSSAPRPDLMVQRIQAGLKAFGNDGIEVDGVVGARTRAAIREFQSLFGLPETGEPDHALYTKMRDIGLTD